MVGSNTKEEKETSAGREDVQTVSMQHDKHHHEPEPYDNTDILPTKSSPLLPFLRLPHHAEDLFSFFSLFL